MFLIDFGVCFCYTTNQRPNLRRIDTLLCLPSSLICLRALFSLLVIMSESLSFGTWLKQRRRTLDLTQEELAQRIACSLSTLRKIEADHLAPSKELAQLLAVAIGVGTAEQAAFVAFARGGQATFAPPHGTGVGSPTPVFVTSPTPPAYYLPTPLTGLVGREREVQSGSALLRRDHVRLLTLVGPPGAGKTRLSLALAKALQAEFAHGVCFVALAPIHEPGLVLSAIAQALHIRECAGRALLTVVQETLAQQQLLLVLDNFEQVMAAAPLVSDLLVAAAALKIIVSSRETLKLYGEYEFPVTPLAVPNIQQLPSPDLLDVYPAVELFVQRARAVRPDFALTTANATAIAHICAWLDGLPLAIEMAAARTKWQSPPLLLEQLRQQLLALTGGPRDWSPRQQTLRGAMDWSYNLLTPVEQQIFVALGVSNGSCTAALMAAVTELDSALCDTLLRGLVEKSLLQCTADEQGELRYTMLQMVREYAQAKQQEQGLQAHLQARHAAFYCRLVAESYEHSQTAAAEHTLNRLALEQSNLQSALAWCLQADRAGGLRLATQLANSLWGVRGHFSEGRTWLEQLLAGTPTTNRDGNDGYLALVAAAWLAAAQMALGQGDLPAAASFATQSEQLALVLREESAVRAALRAQAAIALHQSDYAQATQLYEAALAHCNLNTDQREAAAILNGLGLIAKDQGDYAQALALHARSYQLSITAGDTIGQARALTYSSIAAYWQGEYGRCIDLAQQIITLQQGIGDVISLTYSREILGMALVKVGRFAEGIAVLEASRQAFEQQADRSGVAMVLVDLGQATYAQAAYAPSLAYHCAALQLAHAIGDRRRCAFALEGMAMAMAYLATTPTDYEAAVQRFAAAATLRTAIGAPLPPTDQPACAAALAFVTTRLAEAAYTCAWQTGTTLPVAAFLQHCPTVATVN